MIRDAQLTDAARIGEIYNHYIAHTIITFEETPVDDNEMASRISTTQATLPWIVWTEQDRVLGYAYASTWKSRCAYRYSLESSVYLDHTQHGKGIGKALYGVLLDRLREKGYHTVMGGIALPNEASVALHEKLNFRKVAHFSEVGYKFDQWIDVGYWQLFL